MKWPPAPGTFFVDASANMVLVQRLHGSDAATIAVDIRSLATREEQTIDLRSWLARGFVRLEVAVTARRRSAAATVPLRARR